MATTSTRVTPLKPIKPPRSGNQAALTVVSPHGDEHHRGEGVDTRVEQHRQGEALPSVVEDPGDDYADHDGKGHEQEDGALVRPGGLNKMCVQANSMSLPHRRIPRAPEACSSATNTLKAALEARRSRG